MINETYFKLRPKMINHEPIKGTNFADLFFYLLYLQYFLHLFHFVKERVIEKEYNKVL